MALAENFQCELRCIHRDRRRVKHATQNFDGDLSQLDGWHTAAQDFGNHLRLVDGSWAVPQDFDCGLRDSDVRHDVILVPAVTLLTPLAVHAAEVLGSVS
jgi:hypothetical protein